MKCYIDIRGMVYEPSFDHQDLFLRLSWYTAVMFSTNMWEGLTTCKKYVVYKAGKARK